MKKILILVDILHDKHLQLAEAIKMSGENLDVVVSKMSDVSFYISKDKIEIKISDVSLDNFNLVYFRRVGGGNIHLVGSIIVYLKWKGIKFVDSGLEKTAVRGDKLTSLLRLAIKGISVVPTVYIPISRIKPNFPSIAKEIHEHHLKGVYILKNIKDLESLQRISSTGKQKRFIFQPYLEFSREYRFLVLGGKVKVVHTKVERDFGNIKVDYVDPNSQEEYLDSEKIDINLKNIAVSAAKTLGLDVAGVDICVENKTGETFVLEVNRGPAFNYDQDISPEVQELSKYLISKL